MRRESRSSRPGEPAKAEDCGRYRSDRLYEWLRRACRRTMPVTSGRAGLVRPGVIHSAVAASTYLRVGFRADAGFVSRRESWQPRPDDASAWRDVACLSVARASERQHEQLAPRGEEAVFSCEDGVEVGHFWALFDEVLSI